MTKFIQGEAQDFGLLGIEEKGAQFGLGGRCGDELEDGTRDVNAPFSLTGSPLTGMLPRKKYPPAGLRAHGADRNDALECTLSIMPDAWYRILALGCVHM